MAKREFEKIDKQAAPNWKVKMHEIIFEADTPKGKFFDVVLLWAILASVIAVMLETVDSIKTAHRDFLIILEWAFTILFSIEYFLRLISINKPWKYATSFMGIVDLLSTIPTYISLFIAGPQYLLVIRTIRLLRIFRILKLTRYISEANVLLNALRSSAVKIIVFIGGVVVLVLIMGTLMYIIEGPEHGFSSIPTAMYWTVVTITTVGYGDIAPATTLGQTLASIIMLLGYGIIAVPTGIVGGEIARSKMPRHHSEVTTQSCPNCSEEGHDYDAKYCKNCGEGL
ncbi:ion transporter [Vicingaceae bacterium]|nr:ion transporter [Vicingaceae bacterium]MDB4060717.1 ion transporter [Vicingaceae bacterium]MDB4082709.1 ion transporter [Vicingaceae bacterium]MDB9964304.1 ion transporter [Vicingaceae bacterium]MDC1451993.1 ion transporter [Vicingaceae bacterium]